MKKIIFGFIIGLMVTAIASVNPGQIIKSDLINKILDLKISTGENVFSVRVNGDGSVADESVDFLTSSCSISGNDYFCLYTSSFSSSITQGMNCLSVDGSGSGATVPTRVYVSNSTGFNFSNPKLNTTRIICQKVGSDYHPMKTIRELIEEAGFIF